MTIRSVVISCFVHVWTHTYFRPITPNDQLLRDIVVETQAHPLTFDLINSIWTVDHFCNGPKVRM